MAHKRSPHDSPISDPEKPYSAHDSDVSPNQHVLNNHDPSYENAATNFPNVNEKVVLRKMDLHLLPMLALLYLLSFLDRGNIGNAKIEGLSETLNLTGPQYNWCLTVFFFTYAAFEVPSNLMYVPLPPLSFTDVIWHASWDM